MNYVIYRHWKAKRVKIGDILDNQEKYKHEDFAENAYDGPWAYNEEWFVTQRRDKFIWVLTDYEETSEITT